MVRLARENNQQGRNCLGTLATNVRNNVDALQVVSTGQAAISMPRELKQLVLTIARYLGTWVLGYLLALG